MKKHISHSYIIAGAKGSGKSLIAECFVRALMGEKSCNIENNPDILRLSLETVGKATIGVDAVRDSVVNPMYIKPYKYDYKVCLIDDADKLTPAAQNALLKTMEEPPPYAVIILMCGDANKLLATVLSRSVVITLRPIDTALITRHLLDKGVPKDEAEFASLYSMGSLGQAIKISLDRDFIELRERTVAITSGLLGGLADRLSLADFFTKHKDDIDEVFDILTLWFRDVLVGNRKGEAKIEDDRVFSVLDGIEEARRKLRYNGNFSLTVENMLAGIG